MNRLTRDQLQQELQDGMHGNVLAVSGRIGGFNVMTTKDGKISVRERPTVKREPSSLQKAQQPISVRAKLPPARISVIIRSLRGRILERGMISELRFLSCLYVARKNVRRGQTVQIKVTVTGHAGHSSSTTFCQDLIVGTVQRLADQGPSSGIRC
jgi:hypothetical protein